MSILLENWYLVVASLCVGAVAGVCTYKFVKLPGSAKIGVFKNVLYELVQKAEVEIGSAKGQEKLNYVYTEMCKQFPFIKVFMSMETFETLVDGALLKVGIWAKESK